jgi:DNA helicase-2/ATP-dependent DNA helicase PcrA
MALAIDSNTLIDPDHHFRVFAGPGAGKTHWLVNHIKNVVKTSPRLVPCSYVSCISYTNVAAQEILKRLGQSGDRVQVGTIHSFLYHSVVKPYLYLLKDESGNSLVNCALVDGHDEHRPTFSAVNSWLVSIGKTIKAVGNIHEIFDTLKSVKWQHDEATGKWTLRPSKWKRPKYFPVTKLDLYKQFYWNRGVIDHDDILYFSYHILEQFPIISEFLSLRFPFVFIDEFQDTNPVQTQVVKWLGEHHTLVGIIGDPEQSIYGFQGSKVDDFGSFQLPGQVDYLIDDNRRSTDSIVHVLNHVRGDNVRQKGLRKETGKPVRLYVGDAVAVAPLLHEEVPSSDQLIILTRTNAEASRIRGQNSSALDGLWNELAQIDQERYHFLEHLMAAGELAAVGQYALALNKMVGGDTVQEQDSKKAPEI